MFRNMVATEMMLKKAAVEARYRRPKMMPKRKTEAVALTGICNLGWIWESHLENCCQLPTREDIIE
jgi:hypothetical protein